MAKPCRECITMDEIMRRWPATIGVVIRHRLLCAGCPAAAFHTIDDAIREHGIDGTALHRDLDLAMGCRSLARGCQARPSARRSSR
ncbi:MAG: DUF1858 domain-containing protein [Mesorhizobium sp.]|nr:DUF1858 domain-containing protein [Mesorhizobium sp.]MBL8577256.1 DUF1858 domain-containing protein [Mesorhizobium sp.]